MVKTSEGRMHMGASKSPNARSYGWRRQGVPVDSGLSSSPARIMKASEPCYGLTPFLFASRHPFCHSLYRRKILQQVICGPHAPTGQKQVFSRPGYAERNGSKVRLEELLELQ
jgi:hypothetical protein